MHACIMCLVCYYRQEVTGYIATCNNLDWVLEITWLIVMVYIISSAIYSNDIYIMHTINSHWPGPEVHALH